MGWIEYIMSDLSNIKEIPVGFTILKRCDGIIQKYGKSAGIESNWYYEASDQNNKECVIMWCRPNNFTIIDKESILKIQEIENRFVTWFVMKNGYVAAHIMTVNGLKNIYLHQYLMNYRGYGQGQDSIDHINRNKLDNRLSNLRIISQSEQNENTGKRSRKHNAKVLPEGINQEDLPKFVVYYREKHGKGTREYFTVEKHPIQKLKEQGIENQKTHQLVNKRWATSKSNNILIQDKLKQVIDYINFLDNLI